MSTSSRGCRTTRSWNVRSRRHRARRKLRRRSLRSPRGSRESRLAGSSISRADFETALRPFGAIAAFPDRLAHHLRDEALHRKTYTRVFACQRSERTPNTANRVASIALDVSHRAELFVQQLA